MYIRRILITRRTYFLCAPAEGETSLVLRLLADYRLTNSRIRIRLPTGQQKKRSQYGFVSEKRSGCVSWDTICTR